MLRRCACWCSVGGELGVFVFSRPQMGFISLKPTTIHRAFNAEADEAAVSSQKNSKEAQCCLDTTIRDRQDDIAAEAAGQAASLC